MNERYTTEELEALPVLIQGQADDSRTGIADGEPYENTVTHEELFHGRWIEAEVYDGDDPEGWCAT